MFERRVTTPIFLTAVLAISYLIVSREMAIDLMSRDLMGIQSEPLFEDTRQLRGRTLSRNQKVKKDI